MLLARTLLLINALMNSVFAILILRDTPGMARTMSLTITSDDGHVEFLVMYVGASGLMGLFFLYSAVTKNLLREATLLLAIFMSGIATARLAGAMFFDVGTITVGALAYDLPVAVLAWVALQKLHKSVE